MDVWERNPERAPTRVVRNAEELEDSPGHGSSDTSVVALLEAHFESRKHQSTDQSGRGSYLSINSGVFRVGMPKEDLRGKVCVGTCLMVASPVEVRLETQHGC